MSFLDWAKLHANLYTRLFSQNWAQNWVSDTLGNSHYPGSYYHAYYRAFREMPPLTPRDFASATTVLCASNMLVLDTFTLSEAGFQALIASFNGSPVAAALRTATTDAGGRKGAEAPALSSNVHEHRYQPTEAELAKARAIYGYDIALYEHVLANCSTPLPLH